MRKYQYHLKLSTGISKVPIMHIAYFETRDLFERMLKSWSKLGWSYFETEDDKIINEKAPLVLKYEQGSSLDGILNCNSSNKTYPFYHGKHTYEVMYVKVKSPVE
jgi:hypothetical protein